MCWLQFTIWYRGTRGCANLTSAGDTFGKGLGVHFHARPTVPNMSCRSNLWTILAFRKGRWTRVGHAENSSNSSSTIFPQTRHCSLEWNSRNTCLLRYNNRANSIFFVPITMQHKSSGSSHSPMRSQGVMRHWTSLKSYDEKISGCFSPHCV